MTDAQEAMRQKVRASAPDFFAAIDKHYPPEKGTRVLRALVTADGQEFGNVDDDMRARVRQQAAA